MAGRPTDFNDEIAATICAEIASGRSLRSICDDPGMPAGATVYKWVSKHDLFREQYARAQSDRTTALAEEILEISDDATFDMMEVGDGKFASNSVSVARDKLKVDTRKWLMSKMAPKKYGDKVETTIQGGDNPLQVAGELVIKIVDP